MAAVLGNTCRRCYKWPEVVEGEQRLTALKNQPVRLWLGFVISPRLSRKPMSRRTSSTTCRGFSGRRV